MLRNKEIKKETCVRGKILSVRDRKTTVQFFKMQAFK